MEVQLIVNNDTGRNQSRLDEIKKRLPKVHIFNSDVSDSKTITKLYEKVIKQFSDLNMIDG